MKNEKISLNKQSSRQIKLACDNNKYYLSSSDITVNSAFELKANHWSFTSIGALFLELIMKYNIDIIYSSCPCHISLDRSFKIFVDKNQIEADILIIFAVTRIGQVFR